jgi:hypothetical protein
VLGRFGGWWIRITPTTTIRKRGFSSIDLAVVARWWIAAALTGNES